MAYFNELAEYLQNDIWVILAEKVRNDKEHKKNAKNSNMDFEDYVFEVVDAWLNTHNFDLNNSEWRKQAENSDI